MKIKIKKGLDLNIAGEVKNPENIIKVTSNKIAIYPDDFEGFIPKTCVSVGDHVAVGDSLMYHKLDDSIRLVSPVSGTVSAIVRGERRHIDCIVVEQDGTNDKRRFSDFQDYNSLKSQMLVKILAEAGFLAMMRRRPFADIPSTETLPRDIFVTAFDSAPLANNRQWTDDDIKSMQAGASLLSKVTIGKVYLSSRPGSLPDLKDVVNVTVEGPHPAGLAGVQIANIKPVNKGETVWTLSAETMWRIGQMIRFGTFDPTTYVTVCGSCVHEPYIAQTIIGVQVARLIENQRVNTDRHLRFISGNVLTGIAVDASADYLHFPYTQLTVIPEGDDVDEFMGWASLSPGKMSVSPSFPGGLFKRVFKPDARIGGGRRAMIMSGEYDRVLPMDIMSEYLIKAIQSNNIENMEQLGIYEVAPEDFALAECICSSKMPLQSIVRDGLNFLKKELQ